MTTNELGKALAKPIVLIQGREERLRREALQSLIAAGSPDDFDRQVLDANGSSVENWLGLASTVPFLGDRRVVVIRNLLRVDAPDSKRAASLDKLPPSSLLILVADEDGTEEGDRAHPGVAKWQKFVTAMGGAVLDATVKDPANVKARLREDAKALGTPISGGATDALVEMTGGKYSRAREELEKVSIFVGSPNEIKERDVRTAVIASPEWNVFRMVDAVVAGQLGTALRQLQNLLQSTNKPQDIAFRTILPQLSRNFKLLYQARCAQESGCTLGNYPADLIQTWPQKPNLAKEERWLQSRVWQAAQKMSQSGCILCLRSIADADAQLKGQLPSISASDTLEQLLIACSRNVS